MLQVFAVAVLFITAAASAKAQGSDEQQAIVKARIASRECVRAAESQGLNVHYEATATYFCTFADGTQGFAYEVNVTAQGRCPGNDYTACTPVFMHIATVQVDCTGEVESVTCH